MVGPTRTTSAKVRLLWQMFGRYKEHPLDKYLLEIVEKSMDHETPDIRGPAAYIHVLMTGDTVKALEKGLNGRPEILRALVSNYYYQARISEKSIVAKTVDADSGEIAAQLFRIINTPTERGVSRDAGTILRSSRHFDDRMKASILESIRTSPIANISPGMMLALSATNAGPEEVAKLAEALKDSRPSKDADEAMRGLLGWENPSAKRWLLEGLKSRDAKQYFTYLPDLTSAAAKALAGEVGLNETARDRLIAREKPDGQAPLSEVKGRAQIYEVIRAAFHGRRVKDHEMIDFLYKVRDPDFGLDEEARRLASTGLAEVRRDKLYAELKSSDAAIRERASKSLNLIAAASRKPETKTEVWDQLVEAVLTEGRSLSAENFIDPPSSHVREILFKLHLATPEQKKIFARILLSADLPPVWANWAMQASQDAATPLPEDNLLALFEGTNSKTKSAKDLQKALSRIKPPLSDAVVQRLIELSVDSPTAWAQARDLLEQHGSDEMKRVDGPFYQQAVQLMHDKALDQLIRHRYAELLPLLAPQSVKAWNEFLTHFNEVRPELRVLNAMNDSLSKAAQKPEAMRDGTPEEFARMHQLVESIPTEGESPSIRSIKKELLKQIASRVKLPPYPSTAKPCNSWPDVTKQLKSKS